MKKKLFSRRLFKLQRPIREQNPKKTNCHETRQRMKNTGPEDEPPQFNPPFGRTAIRCPPQNPDRFLAPKSVPRYQHMIPQSKACHHHLSRHFRTHLQLTRHLKGAANCQCKRHLGEDMENRGIKDTSGTRPRSGHISRARTPRGHAHRQGISEAWTPTPVDTGPRSTPLGHGHLQKDT